MNNTMKSQQIAISQLDLHPANVRAKSPETYVSEHIADLKASIKTLGLIQPLVVQKVGLAYGVLAGGRRLAALQELVGDKTAKAFTAKTKVECRVVPDDCDVTTAISLAENVTQAAMSPIDQFEAFARMLEVDNQSIASIAMTFGTSELAVKERLRYGLIHGDIREAVRAKTLTLDAMKAFAGHPSQEVQLEVYQALTQDDARPHAHTVRSAISGRGIQLGDALGGYIGAEYKAEGGAIAADLIEEHSVLEDMVLVSELLEAKLQGAAEAERVRLGFNWADAATQYDYQMFSKYGRVYPTAVEPDAAGQARLEEIAKRVSGLEDCTGDESLNQDEADAIYDEIDKLSEEADDLQTGYTPEALEKGGVIATWNNGRVQLVVGLLRADDQPAVDVTDTAGIAGAVPPSNSGEITYSLALAADLQTERAMALGAAFAQHPETATDLALFKIVSDVLDVGRKSYAMDIAADEQHRTHAKMEELDTTASDQMVAAGENIDLLWAEDHLSPADQFEMFRALDRKEKSKLVAYALGLSIKPSFARNPNADPLMYALEAEVMPDLRAHWHPNAALFGRFKKAQLLKVLNVDLGLTQEALNLSNSSKTQVVDFCTKLFAEPFATLSDAQRAAVATWCPPQMQTQGVAVNGDDLDGGDEGEEVAAAA